MKTMFLSDLVGVAAVSTLAAAPVECQQGTVAQYIGYADGCYIGDKIFENFNLTSVGTKTISETQVQITPITGPDIGLRFSGPFTASGLEVVDTSIAFEVRTASGQQLITGSKLSGDLAQTGLGGAAVDELGLVLNPLGPPFDLRIATGPTNALFPKEISGLMASRLRITKDVFVSGGVTGSGAVNWFQNVYPQVPEPGTWVLVASGLGVAGLLQRRRKRC